MKYFLLAAMLLLSLFPLLADLAFDEPVELYNFESYELGKQSAICPNGNMVMLFRMHKNCIMRTYMQIYTPQNQALLPEPIQVGGEYLTGIDLVVNTNNSIAICHSIRQPETGDYYFEIDTYDAQGNPIPALSDMTLFSCSSYGNYYFLPDGLGGYHFCAENSSNGYLYQHMDANGNIAHPVHGLVIGVGSDESRMEMISTADNGAVITYISQAYYPNPETIKLCKIGADHQISWQTDYPGSVPLYSVFRLLDGPQGSFYAIPPGGVLVYRISYAGNFLWTEAWSPEGDNNTRFVNAISTSNGNLVVQYYHVYTMPTYYTYHQDLIALNGETLFSSQISNPAILMLADHSGGWYAVNDEPSYRVQHYNSSSIPWPEEVLITSNTYSVEITAFIRPENDNLRYIFSTKSGSQTQIRTQEVDSQANTAFAYPGINLLSGFTGSAFGISSVTLPNGSIFTMWRLGYTHYSYPNYIMYNVVTPGGQSFYPEPQCFTEQGMNVRKFWLFALDDGNILICWTRQTGADYATYAQKLNLGSGSMWEADGRLLLNGSGEPLMDFYNNSLYLAQVADSQIRLHRFVDGLPLWDSNGILAGELNPAYLGSNLELSFLTNNCVIWMQDGADPSPWMSFLNIFSEDGSLQYSPQGIPLADESRVYIGAEVSKIYRHGSELIMKIDYIYRVWEYDEGPSSPQSWHYYHDTGFDFLSAGGSLTINPIFQDFSCYRECITSDARYKIPYLGDHSIVKQDYLGNILWSVSLDPTKYMTGLYSMVDGRIMIIYWTYDFNSEIASYYAILSPDGQIEYPAEPFISWGYCNFAYQTDLGMYLLCSSESGDESPGASMQYYTLAPSHNPDPQASPELISLSQNYPNPFRENTSFSLKIPQETQLKLRVFNIRGQCVKTIHNSKLTKGDYLLEWDGKDERGKSCASGVYIFKAEANDASRTIKALKLK